MYLNLNITHEIKHKYDFCNLYISTFMYKKYSIIKKNHFYTFNT